MTEWGSCSYYCMPHISKHDVMVWGVIYFDSWTSLVLISGTLTAQRYVDDILGPVVLPFHLRHPCLTFQQEKALPPTASIAMNCLQTFSTLPQTTGFHDLSSTEHISGVIGRRLQSSQNIDDLARYLVSVLS